MKVTMTRKDALETAKGLEDNLRRFPGGKIAYAAAKNFRITKAVRTDIEEASARREDHEEYYEAVENVLKELGTVQQSGQYLIQEGDRDEYSKRIKGVQEEFSAVVAEIKQQGKEVDELLKEEVELDVHAIAEELVADNETLTGDLTQYLLPFLED